MKGLGFYTIFLYESELSKNWLSPFMIKVPGASSILPISTQVQKHFTVLLLMLPHSGIICLMMPVLLQILPLSGKSLNLMSLVRLSHLNMKTSWLLCGVDLAMSME